MIQISIDDFISGINAISKANPEYKAFCDGSNGFCDEVGLIRGALIRGGATGIRDMKEMNQFVRNIAIDIRKLDSDLLRGDIHLLMTNGECMNVGVVVSTRPLTICYMSHNGLVKDDKLSLWNCVCKIPYIKSKDDDTVYIVHNNDGKYIKMYSTPSFMSPLIEIPNDSEIVVVDEVRRPWTMVKYRFTSGYVLSCYIKSIKQKKQEAVPTIDGFDRAEIEKAYVILGKLLGYIK